MHFLLLLLAAIVLLFKWIYTHFRTRYRFWKEHNVPHLEPRFPVGNAGDTLKSTIHFAHIMDDLYRQLKKYGDYAGIYFFRDPVLVVLSPEFAKTVLVKDFNYFMDRGVYSNEKDDPLSANLFFMEGHRWRKLRAKLTPTFTTGKLKAMFHTILAVGEHFDAFLNDYTAKKDEVEIKDLLARFTTDIIGSCAFGIDCNSLENPNSKFREMGKRMINFPKLKALKIFFAMMFRKQARWLGIRFNDEDVSEFFFGVVRDTIRYREENGVQRKDFMQLLIELKNKGYMEGDSEGLVEEVGNGRLEKLTFEEIAAQAFVFFFAGFETSATTMTFALHLLASNQEVQEQGRKCVTEVLERHDGKFSYEALLEMNYIDCIIQETLRIYPPVATIHRMTTKPYKLPNGSVLPEGIGVVIPNLAFHRDPELFPEPMQFRPERFFEAEKEKRHNFSHLPFGEGPRVCIGMRFGLLQTRMGIAMLLKNFHFRLCSKSDVPLKTDPVNLIYGPAGDVWLGIEKIQ
ncbi:cytochrome P450 6A1-like [Ochlerotatus camptorhynchus]|uniref:cytochrome P450 6A1-like n=1 Tax=Ochlerotatus camptorhynchus TaxID=644619 RepID=UPI0031CFEFF0